MNSKVLELLIGELAYEVAKNGDTSKLDNLVRTDADQLEWAVKSHRPTIEARMNKLIADYEASIAKCRVVLEEIKGD